MALTRFSGEFNAWNYAYGVNPIIPPFQVIAGSPTSGTYSVTLALGVVSTPDGRAVSPVAGVPITIGSGSNVETITPSAVSNPTPLVYGTCVITGTFANAHGLGDEVKSGDFGLQEAATAASKLGGGLVVCDRDFFAAAGLSTNANFTTFVTGYNSVSANVTILNWGGISGALSYKNSTPGSAYASSTVVLY